MDYDMQSDETTEPTMETHCPECGLEWVDCSCSTWSPPIEQHIPTTDDDENPEFPW